MIDQTKYRPQIKYKWAIESISQFLIDVKWIKFNQDIWGIINQINYK